MKLLPPEGTLVTVVLENGELWKTRVRGFRGEFGILCGYDTNNSYAIVYLYDYGESWVYGHTGEDVDALRAARALR